jgi:hypothetical protein
MLEALAQQHSVTLLKTCTLSHVLNVVDLVDNIYVYYEICCMYRAVCMAAMTLQVVLQLLG